MSLVSLRGATLMDTGPLVGWFDRSDQDHAHCRRFFSGHQGVLVSTWPVLTEVCHLVPPQVAPRFLEWIRLGGLQLQDLPATALEPIGGWMQQYGDLPMDLADASPPSISVISASTACLAATPSSMCSTSRADPGLPRATGRANPTGDQRLRPQSTDIEVPGRPCSLRASAWAGVSACSGPS